MAPQVQMWAQNIVYLVGLLICLAASSVILVVLWIALRVYVFRWQQRRSFEAYLKKSRRADGNTYPPQSGGVCEQCGKVKRVVYHLPTGEKMCHDCYEAWWPVVEQWQPGDAGYDSTDLKPPQRRSSTRRQKAPAGNDSTSAIPPEG